MFRLSRNKLSARRPSVSADALSLSATYPALRRTISVGDATRGGCAFSQVVVGPIHGALEFLEPDKLLLVNRNTPERTAGDLYGEPVAATTRVNVTSRCGGGLASGRSAHAAAFVSDFGFSSGWNIGRTFEPTVL
jgi:hypothetical protein